MVGEAAISEQFADPYMETVQKELNVAIGEAFEFVDSDEELLVAVTYNDKRGTYVFDALFEFGYTFHSSTYHGKVKLDGVSYLTPEAMIAAKIDHIDKTSDRIGSIESLRTRLLEGVLGCGPKVVSDAYVGMTKHSCKGCNGHGELTCRACNGRGTGVCHCSDGWVRCPACSMTGSRGNVSCSCIGRGWVYCGTCNGTAKAQCQPCRGSGSLQCRGCSGHGYLTEVHSCKFEMRPELSQVSTDFEAPETTIIRRWAEEGFKGRAAKPAARWLAYVTLDEATVATLKVEGASFVKRIGLSIKATHLKIAAKFEDQPAQISYMKLDEAKIRFSPFLNEEAKKLCEIAKSASSDSPSEFLSKFAKSPGIAAAIQTTWNKQENGMQFAKLVSDMTYGAIEERAVAGIQFDYQYCLNKYRRNAVRQSTVMPSVLLAAMWVTGQAFHVNSLAADFAPVGAVVGTIVPAVLVGLAINGTAKKRVRRETGHDSTVTLGLDGLMLPLAAAAIFAATFYWNINIWPW